MSERAEKNLLYGNWEVQAPDGTILFLALQERADWYLERGLAVAVGDNKIRLNFEPKGKRDPNDLYSISAKSNNCVVCNDSDIIILTKHHNEYEAEADKFKQKIAEDYGVEFTRNKLDDNVIFGAKWMKEQIEGNVL